MSWNPYKYGNRLGPFQERPAVGDDIKREPKTVERMREWAHGDGTSAEYCTRQSERIYTAPDRIPGKCSGSNGYNHPYTGVPVPCENENWSSTGIVHRIKEDGKIIHREPEIK